MAWGLMKNIWIEFSSHSSDYMEEVRTKERVWGSPFAKKLWNIIMELLPPKVLWGKDLPS
jgi:hypothetical protein